MSWTPVTRMASSIAVRSAGGGPGETAPVRVAAERDDLGDGQAVRGLP
jgi:hypothetical protein